MIPAFTKHRGSSVSYLSTILASSPLGYWRLGESSGSTAADSSGNGYNGTYVSCTQGTASLISNNGGDLSATFNGSTSEITVGAVAALYNLNRSFTIEWWMNPAAVASGTAYGVWSAGINGFAARLNGTGLEILVDYSASLGVIPANFAASQLYYCVLTVSSAGIATLYVNGSAVGTINVSGHTFAGGYVRIGADGSNSTTWASPFSGVLDEVAVYNAVLTTSQITQHYNAGRLTAANNYYRSIVLTDSPSDLWPMNDASGSGSIVNQIRSANNGTVSGALTFGTTGVSNDSGGAAIEATGTNQYITYPTPVAGMTTFTVESFIKTITSGSRQDFILFGDTTNTASNNTAGSFYLNSSNRLAFDLANVPGPVGGVINDGAFHHCAAVVTSGKVQLYIDGVPSGAALSMSPAIANKTGYLFWAAVNALSNYPTLNGYLQDLAFYPSALSESRVAAHFAASGLAKTATTAFSSDGSSLTGWTVSGVTVSSGTGNPAPSFSAGTNQYAYINAGVTNYCDVQFDIYVTSGTTDLADFFFGCSSAGAGYGFRVDCRGSANPSGLITTTSWTAWSTPATVTWTGDAPGVWHTCLVKIRPTGTALYIDGVFKGATNVASIGGSYIAVQGDGGSGGYFDNIKVTTYA